MVKQVLTGGAYQSRSVIASAQRSLNLFTEPLPQDQREPMPAACYPTPGTTLLSTIGTGPIRGIRQATTGAIYLVSGNGVYSVDPTTWAGTHLGDITYGLRTPVSMADNGLDMVIVDGTGSGWKVTLVGNVFAPIVQSGTIPPVSAAANDAIVVDRARYTTFTAPYSAVISRVNVTLVNGYTGNMKCAVFDADAAVIGSARVLANPGTGINSFTFDNPVAISAGKKYWIGFVSDKTLGTWSVGADATAGQASTTAYKDFPVAAPVHTPINPLIVSLAISTDPAGMFVGGDKVDFLDGYLLFNKPQTPQFYSSDSLALTFDPLWFANKESYSDLLVTLAVVNRDIWLLGERTTEVWTNVGKPDFPMERKPGIFIDHGTVAKYSPAVYDNGLFWLSRDRQGQGIVILGAGDQTKRVSTYAIENEIAGYATISDAIGYCYQLGGHAFYVLTFPTVDKTWVYDITTGHWHEWAWIDANGAEHRHRSNCFWPCNGKLVVGDWENGNLYALDHKVFTDNGQSIKRVRSFPHVVNDGKRVFYRQFIADFDAGNEHPNGTVTTTYETIITWLPNIAQMTGVNVGAISSPNFGGALIDWERGYIYMIGQGGYQKFTTALETRGPLVTVPVTPTLWSLAHGFIDPTSGYLILQSGAAPSNSTPISKHDPNTFAVVDTFGTRSSSFLPYPTGVTIADRLTGVVCNGVCFGFIKYSIFSGVVSGFRCDTMEHTGFSQAIVAGSTNNRGNMIAGKSGGSTASVFLSWDGTTTIAPAVPLYRIDIVASATSYDPATWPTTNPGITWTTVGTIPVAAVDPTWTGFTVYSMGYDRADGNVLMAAGTQNSAQGYRILKLNKDTAAVMWNITVGTATIDLDHSRINGSLWFFRNPGAGAGPTTSYRIDTLTGTMTTQPITGVFAGANEQMQQSDSETSTMFYGGTFNIGTGAPNPVDGTSTFSSGWASMGGQTIRTIVTNTQTPDQNLISLEWSDDRGHSWANPVTQTIGEIGEYRTSISWNRCGMARDRVWRLSWSVPMAVALQGAWFDATPGQS